MGLTDRCAFYIISRTQRERETARGLDESGTIGYEKTGCYECDGRNTECFSYTVKPNRKKGIQEVNDMVLKNRKRINEKGVKNNE